MSVNTPTAKACSGNGHMSGPEPKTASLIAMDGNEASFSGNVLEVLKDDRLSSDRCTNGLFRSVS